MAEANTFKAELEKALSENNSLEKRLNETVEAFETNFSLQNKRMEELIQEKSDLHEKLQELLRHNHYLKQENDKYSGLVIKLNGDKNLLQAEVSSGKSKENKEKQLSLMLKEAENAKNLAKRELDEIAKKFTEKFDKLNKEIGRYKQEKDEAGIEILELKNMIDRANKENIELKRVFNEKNEENSRIDEKNIKKLEKAAELQSEADNEILKLKEALTEENKKTFGLEKTIERLNKENFDLIEENKRKTKEKEKVFNKTQNDYLESKMLVDKFYNENSELKSLLEKANKENFELLEENQKILIVKEGLEKESFELKSQVDKLIKEIAELKRVLEEAYKEIFDLTNENHSKIIEKEGVENENFELKSQVHKLNEENFELKNRLENSEIFELPEKNTEKGRIKNENNLELKNFLEKTKKENSDLKRFIEKLNKENLDQKSETQRKIQKTAELQKELEKAKKDLIISENLLENKDKEILYLKTELKSTNNKQSAFNKQTSEQEKTEKLYKSLEDSKKEIERLNFQIEILKKQTFAQSEEINSYLLKINDAKGHENRLIQENPNEYLFTNKEAYRPEKDDPIDIALSDYINTRKTGLKVPFEKKDQGLYSFGTKKIYIKLEQGKLVIRVGGGYMQVDDFVQLYSAVELERFANLKKEQANNIRKKYFGKHEGSADFKSRKEFSPQRGIRLMKDQMASGSYIPYYAVQIKSPRTSPFRSCSLSENSLKNHA